MKKKLLPVVTAFALLAMPVGQAVAANKPTPPSGSGGQMHMSASQMSAAQPAMSGWDMVKMRTTAKMRAKAARNAHLKGKPAQAAAATTYVESKGPDYFGTSPNYASSPMPRLTWSVDGVVPAFLGTPKLDPKTKLPMTTPNPAAEPCVLNAQGLPIDVNGVLVVAPAVCKPNPGFVAGSPATLPVWIYAPTPASKVGDPVILPVYDPTTGTFTNPVNNSPLLLANTPFLIDPASLVAVAPAIATPKPLLDPINQIPQLDYKKVSIAGGIRKFVEPLPGVGAPAAGSTMQNFDAALGSHVPSYIPVATPDTTSFPGSDYYEIGLKEYYQTFSPDLQPTRLRGYYQKNAPTAAEQRPFYLGPIIVATANRPVRVKFTNELPTGTGGDLFLPVDTSAMGAGTGPDGTSYSQNRAVIHLHGGLTPWISDGTPNQWTTPAGETTHYPKGVSVYGVPDMPSVSGPTDVAGNDGSLTFYYTNKQSARLMWYHDHAYGLTRLNVYAGEVSAYQLDSQLTNPTLAKSSTNPVDPANPQAKFEALLPAASNTVPLVIQDKAFVPDDIPSGYFPNGQLTDQDPTWNRAKWGAAGSGALWFPHVYMPNQNPYDNSGANAMGRWDYGPWFWPIFGTSAGLVHGEIPNPYAVAGAPWEPPFIPGTPSTYTNGVAKKIRDANGNLVDNPIYSTSDASLAPEAFVDTPVINGVAYPYMSVKPEAYRFRILNGANDRYWNLQMYCSAADKPSTTGFYTVANANTNTLPMWANTADRLPQNPAAG